MLKIESRVFAHKAAKPKAARKHFEARLAFETDPSDVYSDMKNGIKGFVLLDNRSPESFEREHIKDAINLWHREIDKKAAKKLDKKILYITSCTGVGCNASTKAAAKLSKLGFKVKELTGGLKWWKDEGYPTVKGK